VIEGGETPDKRLGLIRNRVPVWDLKLDFEVGAFLGKGDGIVGKKRGSRR